MNRRPPTRPTRPSGPPPRQRPPQRPQQQSRPQGRSGPPPRSKPRRQYWENNQESIRRSREAAKNQFENPWKGEQFIPKNGESVVRILPPTWENADHWAMLVYEHRYIGSENGSYICPKKWANKPCPMCEAADAARRHGDTDEAKALAPKTRWICYVLHRNAEDRQKRWKPLVWDIDYKREEEITGRTTHPKTGKAISITNPDNGYDLFFKTTGKGGKDPSSVRYLNFDFDRDPSPVADDPKLYNRVLDYIDQHPLDSIMKVYDYEHLAELMMGTQESADPDLDQENDQGGEYYDDQQGDDNGEESQEESYQDTQGEEAQADDQSGDYQDEYPDDQGSEEEATGDEAPEEQYADDGGDGSDGDGGYGEPDVEPEPAPKQQRRQLRNTKPTPSRQGQKRPGPAQRQAPRQQRRPQYQD
jgi:hypothetical protein